MSRVIPQMFIRTARANLAAEASADNLIEGEPYLITDAPTLAIGTSVNAFIETVRNDGGVSGIQVLTQAEYDALEVKAATTLYFIKG